MNREGCGGGEIISVFGATWRGLSLGRAQEQRLHLWTETTERSGQGAPSPTGEREGWDGDGMIRAAWESCPMGAGQKPRRSFYSFTQPRPGP